MTQYFIRYSNSAEYLQNDLERGYSFTSYVFDTSAEALLAEHLGVDVDDLEDEYNVDELIEEYNVAPNSNGRWGFAENGLCGYGPFASVAEAKASLQNGYLGMTVCGIYEGHEAGFDRGGSLDVLFRPTALVEVFDVAEVAAA